MEKELERQRLLELEHAKTRELRHSLDMEKERQTQVILFPTLSELNKYTQPSCFHGKSFPETT